MKKNKLPYGERGARKFISCRIESEIYEKAKAAAEKEHETISLYIHRAIENELSQNRKIMLDLSTRDKDGNILAKYS